MKQTYFLGANTPEGFRSHYGVLFRDPRIRRLYILKGGPGCGKSTLMRTVSAAAQAKGCDVEEILCASDPDSLDGLIVPKVGLAIADGTAPHVLEPPLCGLGACYLDLGAFYDPVGVAQAADALHKAAAENEACRRLAQEALCAVGAADRGCRQLAEAALPKDFYTQTAAELLPPLPAPAAPEAAPLDRFCAAITPAGLRTEPPRAAVRVLLQDSRGLSDPLLRAVEKRYREAGYQTVRGWDPLRPDSLLSVRIPSLDTLYAVSSPWFPVGGQAAAQLDLDARSVPAAACQQQHAAAFSRLRSAALETALRLLAEAKQRHDQLEAAYRPYVDFTGVQTAAERLAALLEDAAF